MRNYLNIALRSLYRRPGYSLLNIAGLAMGMAAALLILLYVQDELSYDRYHAHADRIYRLIDTGFSDTDYTGLAKVNGPWGPTLKETIPEVEAVTRFVFFGTALMERGEVRAYQAGGFFADSSIFDVFDFPLKSGNPTTALVEPRSIVIDQELATTYFGDADPVGQTLYVDNSDENTQTGPYTVTGVLGEVPLQSHFTFRYLVSMSTYHHPEMQSWVVWNQFYTYALLREGADPKQVMATYNDAIKRHIPEEHRDRFVADLQPLTHIHLYSTLFREIAVIVNADYVFIFLGIAFFILLIACVNYINLSTARAAKRMKEVGLRKMSGAPRATLIQQFLGESLLTTGVALIAAIGLAGVSLGPFNSLTGKDFDFGSFASGFLPLVSIGLWLFVGLASGSYPAFMLSRYKPVSVLKGFTKGEGKSPLRKGLVVFQFAISTFLIIATGVVMRQVRYMQDKKLGFNQEHLVVIPIRSDVFRNDASTIKHTLRQHPGVAQVALSGNLPGGGDWGIPLRPEGIAEDQVPSTRILVVDPDFVDTYQMELASGHGFSEDRPSETATGYLMNEEAVRQYGWEEPVGKTIAMPAINREAGPVIGVLKDFHFRSMHEEIGPMVFFCPPIAWYTFYTVRIQPGMTTETLAYLEETWQAFDPAHPFTFYFLDEQLGQLHAAEEQMSRLLSYFSVLAIAIACLGLFGLAVYTAAQRTKEIGVRKVLGASVFDIVMHLTSGFTWLVLIGFLAAAPLAYLASERWLQSFAYQAGVSVWLFVGSGVLVMLLAFLTVSYQSIRAARANPVKALRYE